MKKTSAFIFMFLLGTVLTSSIASACSYVYQEPQETYDENAFVFIGSITNVRLIGGSNGTRAITFEVLKSYKGVVGKTITLTTSASSASCGFENGTLSDGDIWVIHSNSAETFNSLPHNQKYSSLQKAQEVLDPLSDERPKFCPLNYAPVCGMRDTGIRCITTPCPSTEIKTYGNSCQLAVDKAEFLYDGECKVDPNMPDTKPPVYNSGNNPVVEPQATTTQPSYDVDASETEEVSIRGILQKINSFFKWLFWFV